MDWLKKASFKRVVKKVSQKYNKKFREEAVDALQEASEAYVVKLFENASICTILSKRSIVKPEHVRFVQKIYNEL